MQLPAGTRREKLWEDEVNGSEDPTQGRTDELELSKLFQGYGYPVEPGRALNCGEAPDLSGLPGVHIECKRCETLRRLIECSRPSRTLTGSAVCLRCFIGGTGPRGL